MEQLAKSIAEENAVLKSLVTDQMWVNGDVGTTWVRFFIKYWYLVYGLFLQFMDSLFSQRIQFTYLTITKLLHLLV